MLHIKPEQVSTGKEYSPWVVDVEENDLPTDPQSIKNLLMNKEVEYLGLNFKIEGIEFFKIVQKKIVLLCREL